MKKKVRNSKLYKNMLGGAALTGIGAFLLAPGRVSDAEWEPFEKLNVAHRGFHSKDGSIPENSLPAFEKAVEKGYGIELDIRLSKDGQIVVFHDANVKRMTGVDARIEELTGEQIAKLSLKATKEAPPTLDQVLTQVAGKVPIIIEVKSSKTNEELCSKALSVLRKYPGVFAVESFDPRIVRWFKNNAPEVIRGQLAMPPNYYEDTVPRPLAYAVGLGFANVVGRPQFIAYRYAKKPISVKLAERFGAKKVCWTLENYQTEAEKENDTIIFQYYEPEVRFSKEKTEE